MTKSDNRMSAKNVLIVSDNQRILEFVFSLLNEQPELQKDRNFDFVCSPLNKKLVDMSFADRAVKPLDVKIGYPGIIDKYDLVISAHCKQLFPKELVESVRCVNIHPGFNPYNRGWYPQVFSIINGLPLGATLHEIDADIDHGAIIDQQEVEISLCDTSEDAYNKVFEAEKKILGSSLGAVLGGNYITKPPQTEGNLNLKKDFEELCAIDLSEKVSFKEAIDRLRALTHGGHKNAYFVDEATNQKVYVSIKLECENE